MSIEHFQKHRHPSCYYLEPRIGAAISFERIQRMTAVSGTYTSVEGTTYAMESIGLLREHRPGSIITQEDFPNLSDDYVGVYRLSASKICILY